MERIRKVIGIAWAVMGFCVLTSAVGQQAGEFFRIVSPTNTAITALSSDGLMVWTNAAIGATCVVQRASSVAGTSNWVDYVREAQTNATMAVRLFDLTPPAGMILIPAGCFQMGDSKDGMFSAQPVHAVRVSAFYMDTCEVTWGAWREVRDWSATNGYGYDNTGAGKADSHPVQTVNWYDAVKWCNARSQKEGKSPAYFTDEAFTQVYKAGQAAPYVNWSALGYRLPTEAEWEKASRGGVSGRRFPWGDTINQTYANYKSLWRNGAPVAPYDTNPTSGYHPDYDNAPEPYTSPAGSFAPNGYGLYDMSGNVYEWCWDWLEDTYYETAPSEDPRGASVGEYRVLRGGGWFEPANGCRAAYRGGNTPDFAHYEFGFRSVLPSRLQ